jgi:hypothetical protein
MLLWSSLKRAAIALQVRLEMCPHVEKGPYSMYQMRNNGSAGTYEGTLYLTDDYYIVIAKRIMRDGTQEEQA